MANRPHRWRPRPPTLVGTPREFTLLKAIAPPNADGTIRCTVVTRFETGLPPTTSGMVGVRALKLSGTNLPVRVRVLTEDGKPHPRASLLTVMGTDGDYAVDPGARDGFAYDPADGTFKSARPLQSIACLVVGLSPTYSERFPVPLVGSDVITVRFPINEEKARKAELEKATMALRLKIGESHRHSQVFMPPPAGSSASSGTATPSTASAKGSRRPRRSIRP